MMGLEKLSRKQLIAVGMAGYLVAVFAPMLLLARLDPQAFSAARVLAFTMGTAIAVAWWLVIMRLLFLKSDEFHQAAAKFAWHWGGMIGLMSSAPVYLFLVMGGTNIWLPGSWPSVEVSRGFVWGYALAFGSVVAGCIVAGLVWRFTRR